MLSLGFKQIRQTEPIDCGQQRARQSPAINILLHTDQAVPQQPASTSALVSIHSLPCHSRRLVQHVTLESVLSLSELSDTCCAANEDSPESGLC